MKVDVLVVGAGPAGLSAAIALKESGIDSLVVIERESEAGGILRQCIHNGFGLHRFKEELTGPEYAARDIDKANEMGVDIRLNTTVLSVSKDKTVTCISRERGVETFECKAVILCMGCRERPRGALGTPGTRCAGIFSAGTAQKFVNLMGLMPGKEIVILGSGDIGLIMARRMTLQGAKVKACIEIMPYSSGLNRNIVQCLDDYDIPLYLSHTITDIKGRERLSSVTVSKVDENRLPIPGSEFDIPCDTLLLSVGLIPENELTLGAGISLSPATSGAVVDDGFETEMPGIFTAGNVLHVHDLVDHVSDEAARAGHAAAQYIKNGETEKEMLNVVDGKGVRGAVPQKINRFGEGDVRLLFRPDKVYENAEIGVYCGDTLLKSRKARILTPGEMAEIVVSREKLSGINKDIIISVWEGSK